MKLVKQLKEANQDHEFYPTTNEILAVISKDYRNSYRWPNRQGSILDIGAGNGKALNYLKETKQFKEFYAIEKSSLLISQLPEGIKFIGGDFHEQTLIDKYATVTFCNPPYSEFAEWSEKVIREANSEIIYLVIPDRWKTSQAIEAALENRGAEAKTIHTTDFLESEDRKARAKVDVLKIDLRAAENSDSFTAFFNDIFKEEIASAEARKESEIPETQQERLNALTDKRSIVEVMVEAYNHELTSLQNNYRDVCRIPDHVLKSIETSLNEVKSCLRQKLVNLKKEYWCKLFDRMDSITSRLTTTTREMMVNKLNKNIGIDFTNGNVFEVVCWAVKHANEYFDKQFTDFYKQLINQSSVINYKSNKRVFTDNDWRYNCKPDNSHFKLDYRIVKTGYGGILRAGEWSTYGSVNNLAKNSVDFLNDLKVIANNLGFTSQTEISDYEWKAGKTNSFYYNEDGESLELVEVKGFYNGNLHLRFCQKFMQKMNIEHGRLTGWIHSPQEAAEEMNIDEETAVEMFATSFKITPNSLGLMHHTEEEPKQAEAPSKPKQKIKPTKKRPSQTRKKAPTTPPTMNSLLAMVENMR